MNEHKHPERSEMISAIRAGDTEFAKSLAGCDSCVTEFSYLKSKFELLEQTIVSPPDDALMRHQGIARLMNARRPSPTVVGEILYDSWTTPPPQAVRSSGVGVERRVSLSSGEFVLELVAERNIDRWEFVARVYRNRKVCSEFSLKAGHQALYPQQGKCYFWSSKRPTRRIQLQSADINIDFGELKW